jgi:hypothetical protein
MNTKSLIALVLALLGPACASAQSAAPAPLTRAEVTAELYRARAAGEICGNEAECDQMPARSSAAVDPRAAAAARNIHICQNEAECDAAPRRTFTVTRAEVQAELYRARAAGEIAETEADNDIGRAELRRKTK